jgi:uncharacterized protein (TIGR03067 family)
MSIRIRVGGVVIGLLTALTYPAEAADKAKIERAIVRGVVYLKQTQQPNGAWQNRSPLAIAIPASPDRPERTSNLDDRSVGATALAGLTLLECGVNPEDPVVEKAATAVREAAITLDYTYAISLTILFLDRLGDADDVPLIQSLMVRLIAGQTASGGWSYNCPANIGELEIRRLKGLVANRKSSGRKREGPEATPKHDAAREIDRQMDILANLRLQNVARSGAADGDNSNTQFATLALWVGHRYGIPIRKPLSLVEQRFRLSQGGDGGWDYSFGQVGLAIGRGSSPSMTCAGLLGLAVAFGVTNETAMRGAGSNNMAKPLGPPSPRATRDPARDNHIKTGLMALGNMLKEPLADRPGARLGLKPAAVAPDQIGLNGRSDRTLDYYFLWSLERVAMVYGLQRIGGIDWYERGSTLLVDHQANDGSWQGSYGEGGVDTSFALLFLVRSNLARDLASNLKGEIRLKSGGIGGESLTERAPDSDGPAKEKGDKDNPTPKNTSPSVPAGNHHSAEAKENGSIDPAAERLCTELVQASPKRQEELLEKLKEGKGVVNTQALAAAVPRLTGPIKTKARDALAERLTRMTNATLRDKLLDEQPEVRRAAALACAMKEEKQFVPNLINLLEDRELTVSRAAVAALKALTGQDFGPAPSASGSERTKAVAKWKEWWTKQIDASGPVGESKSGDKEKLQGTWMLVSVESQGKPLSKAQLAKLMPRKVVFSGDHMTLHFANFTQQGKFDIDPSVQPKEIDRETKNGTSRGIYVLEGDTLKICAVPEGEERPKEMTTDVGSQQILYVFKRQSP